MPVTVVNAGQLKVITEAGRLKLKLPNIPCKSVKLIDVSDVLRELIVIADAHFPE